MEVFYHAPQRPRILGKQDEAGRPLLPPCGELNPLQIAHQIKAEGVGHVDVVTDGTSRTWHESDLPHGVLVRHRDEFDAVQKEMRACPGVSGLIYDQTCAAEKRRRRKRGRLPDPPLRVFLNEAACEGCGDCSVQSNCLAVVPVETALGTKRAIDQSACNKDFSCLKGFCPSFVTIEGGRLRRENVMDSAPAISPAPNFAELLADRVRRLTDYQDAALAERYRTRVEVVRHHPAADEALARVVARNYYRLLAVKDEYEVARLYAETDFLDRIAAQFEGAYRLHFHLAPPLIARADPNTGLIAKRRYGSWMMMASRWLARMRKLRGTRWDIFARSPERKLARQWLADYEEDITLILARLERGKLPAALELAGWPEQVRGYGPLRAKSALAARHQREEARAKLAD